MDESTIIEIPAGALMAMTVEQLHSLQNIVAPGSWDTVKEPVRVSGVDYLGVYLPGFFIGIEKDGYSHS